MENFSRPDKENLFEAINCSPILPSGNIPKENRAENYAYSPLSEQNRACQGNRLHSPKPRNIVKVGLFLSTPVREPSPLPDSWEELRKLDEDEHWIERTQVVTKEDHILYCETAKEIVSNIIDNLPAIKMDESNPGCDTTVTETSTDSGLDISNSGEVDEAQSEVIENVVGEERKENVPTEIKDVTHDNETSHILSDSLLGTSIVQDDNDFIHSCSDLDTTVKEMSANDESSLENTLSKDSEDLDETVKEITAEELQANLPSTVTDHKNLVDGELSDDISLHFDEDSFKTSAAFGLELDFLESCGQSSGTEHISDLARQSLYVKFDPLVEAQHPPQSSQGASSFANIKPADLLFQGSLASDDLLGMDTPPEKPVISRRALLAQTETNEAEESSASDQTTAPVDLLELSPCQNIPVTNEKVEEEIPNTESNIEPAEQSSLVQPLQFSKDDLEKAVKEEREKLMSQWNLQNSLHEAEMEKLLEERNKTLEDRSKIINENKVVKTLMMEYEQTMAQMIKDRENEQSAQKKSNSETIQERDQLQRDLNNTEKSFAHLHEKFGKLKTAVESYRKNEEVLKKVVKDLQADVKNAEAKYQVLKNHAEQKLQEANVEINRVQTTFKTELAGIQAALKREKTKVSSLQQSLDQKVNENKELTAICDELISKVGPMS